MNRLNTDEDSFGRGIHVASQGKSYSIIIFITDGANLSNKKSGISFSPNLSLPMGKEK